jgi:hypothetical protein
MNDFIPQDPPINPWRGGPRYYSYPPGRHASLQVLAALFVGGGAFLAVYAAFTYPGIPVILAILLMASATLILTGLLYGTVEVRKWQGFIEATPTGITSYGPSKTETIAWIDIDRFQENMTRRRMEIYAADRVIHISEDLENFMELVEMINAELKKRGKRR